MPTRIEWGIIKESVELNTHAALVKTDTTSGVILDTDYLNNLTDVQKIKELGHPVDINVVGYKGADMAIPICLSPILLDNYYHAYTRDAIRNGSAIQSKADIYASLIDTISTTHPDLIESINAVFRGNYVPEDAILTPTDSRRVDITPRQRANIAIDMIRQGTYHTSDGIAKEFENCFEMGDDVFVMFYITNDARTDSLLASRLLSDGGQYLFDRANHEALYQNAEACLAELQQKDSAPKEPLTFAPEEYVKPDAHGTIHYKEAYEALLDKYNRLQRAYVSLQSEITALREEVKRATEKTLETQRHYEHLQEELNDNRTQTQAISEELQKLKVSIKAESVAVPTQNTSIDKEFHRRLEAIDSTDLQATAEPGPDAYKLKFRQWMKESRVQSPDQKGYVIYAAEQAITSNFTPKTIKTLINTLAPKAVQQPDEAYANWVYQTAKQNINRSKAPYRTS